ncbi:hypothetical protein sr17391 [Sporisorium reilianum SRZ2]|uniref:Uncharacterized protein n=1 Tax=Sporisorium reilianum (strain SRZ2) TaxID=999809 RepID=E6ZVU3_SPORE|nr:hypothetical protein sr17391 [Sporisorium reilianum SRZ2]
MTLREQHLSIDEDTGQPVSRTCLSTPLHPVSHPDPPSILAQRIACFGFGKKQQQQLTHVPTTLGLGSRHRRPLFELVNVFSRNHADNAADPLQLRALIRSWA